MPAPIQPFQSLPGNTRVFSSALAPMYNHNPSPEYLQREADILASLEYLSDDPATNTPEQVELWRNADIGFRFKLSMPTDFNKTVAWKPTVFATDYYPSEWGTNTALFDAIPAARDWKLKFLRSYLDVCNVARYMSLTPFFVEAVYEYNGGVPGFSMGSRIKPFAPGFGTRIVPRLELLLAYRNAEGLTSQIVDNQNTPNWNAKAGSCICTTLDQYLPNGRLKPEFPSVSAAHNFNVGATRKPEAQYNNVGYSFAKAAQSPTFANYSDGVFTWSNETKEEVSALQAAGWVGNSRVVNAIKDLGGDAGCLTHETHGHSHFGQSHVDLGGGSTWTPYVNECKANGYISPEDAAAKKWGKIYTDVPYTISYGYWNMWDNYSTRWAQLMWFLMQEGNDYYGRKFREWTGVDVEYK